MKTIHSSSVAVAKSALNLLI